MLVRMPQLDGVDPKLLSCETPTHLNVDAEKRDFLMNTYDAYNTISAPDKGEVGGSSPPRPTIQIPEKYAARVLKSTLGQGAAPRGILGASQLQESRLV